MAVIPMLAYEDGAAAIDWLVEAFGFEERERHADDEGTITHAELDAGGSTIMLATPTPDYVSPKRMRELSPEARRMAEIPYIIDGLLEPLQADDRRDLLDWSAIADLRQFGGIRIEDNVLVEAGGVRNLTREAFAAA